MLTVYAIMFLSTLLQPILLAAAAVAGWASRRWWLASLLGAVTGAIVFMTKGETPDPITLLSLNVAAGALVSLLTFQSWQLLLGKERDGDAGH